jgi:hypothetical protein
LNFKLGEGDSLMKHYQAFDALVSELLSAGANLEEPDKVIHLFMTLPSSYNGVFTTIETLADDNLNLTFVKTTELDHEIKINENRDTALKVLAKRKSTLRKLLKTTRIPET